MPSKSDMETARTNPFRADLAKARTVTGPCSCTVEYTKRGLVDPSCDLHRDAFAIASLIAAERERIIAAIPELFHGRGKNKGTGHTFLSPECGPEVLAAAIRKGGE